MRESPQVRLSLSLTSSFKSKHVPARKLNIRRNVQKSLKLLPPTTTTGFSPFIHFHSGKKRSTQSHIVSNQTKPNPNRFSPLFSHSILFKSGFFTFFKKCFTNQEPIQNHFYEGKVQQNIQADVDTSIQIQLCGTNTFSQTKNEKITLFLIFSYY